MNKHSKIGASSMHRWSVCSGSVRMCDGLESSTSSYAQEGIDAHELAAEFLKGNSPINLMSEEISDAVNFYVEAVRSDAGQNPILVEVKFDLSVIHPGLYGTADAVVYDPLSKILRVIDLKMGKGILVEVEDNAQLMYYALGALLHTAYPASIIELVIIQPRANHVDGPIRRMRLSTAQLIIFAAKLRKFAEATEDPNAPLVSGDHCRFCPAAGICPEIAKKALAIAQAEFSPTAKYDPLVLGETLKKLDLLEDYSKQVRDFAYQEAMNGRCPPGWKLVNKRAVRKWNKDEEEIASELECILPDQECYWDKKLKSPAQVEKLLGKNGRQGLQDLVVLVSSGLTLVPESDSRQPALVSAESEFGIVEG